MCTIHNHYDDSLTSPIFKKKMSPILKHYLRSRKGIKYTAQHFGLPVYVVGAIVCRYHKSL